MLRHSALGVLVRPCFGQSIADVLEQTLVRYVGVHIFEVDRPHRFGLQVL